MDTNRKIQTATGSTDRTRSRGIRRGLEWWVSAYVATYEKHFLASGKVDDTVPLRWYTGA